MEIGLDLDVIEDHRLVGAQRGEDAAPLGPKAARPAPAPSPRHHAPAAAARRRAHPPPLPALALQSQMLHSAAPWAAMLYRFDPEDETKGAIEMTPTVRLSRRRRRLGQPGSCCGRSWAAARAHLRAPRPAARAVGHLQPAVYDGQARSMVGGAAGRQAGGHIPG